MVGGHLALHHDSIPFAIVGLGVKNDLRIDINDDIARAAALLHPQCFRLAGFSIHRECTHTKAFARAACSQ
ncbi:MAG: hypothetical protein WDO15_13640 [Bacteroidota bacterium]